MLTVTAALALVIAYIALIVSYLALRTLSRLRRSAVALAGGTDRRHGRRSLIEITEEHIRATGAVAAEIEQVRHDIDAARQSTTAALNTQREEFIAAFTQANAHLEEYRGQVDTSLAYAVRNVALVRFDAFDDMAGRMSFSVALLDDNGDGITLSSIAGHSDTRVYAKGVRAGQGEHDLSPEEQSAVTAAIRNRVARPTTRRRASRRAS
jgi:hypothetical protein